MPKRRAHGDGGLYFIKSRKLWRGVVDAGFDSSGKRVQKYVHARSQTDARNRLDELKRELAEHGRTLDRTTTVAAWSETWLEEICRPNLKPSGLRTYTSLVRTWIVPTIGHKRVSALRPTDARQVYKAIKEAGRASATALKVHQVLSSMLADARRDKLIAVNIMAEVDPPRPDDSTRDALSTDDALRVLAAAAQLVDGTRWWVALLAALRQGERLGATIDSIDFGANEFHVQWSLTEATFEHGCSGTCSAKRGGSCPARRLVLPDGIRHRVLEGRMVLVPPKSGKTRVVPLLPQVAEALRRYLAATADWPNPHGLIWRRPDGSPITGGEDNEAWRALLLAAGVITPAQALAKKDRPEGTPETPTTHWARHTTVTVLMELGVPPKIAAEIAGHADVAVTDRYTHVSSAAAHDAMAKLGQHFGSALAIRGVESAALDGVSRGV